MDIGHSETCETARMDPSTEDIHDQVNRGEPRLFENPSLSQPTTLDANYIDTAIENSSLQELSAVTQDIIMEDCTAREPATFPLTHALEALLGGIDSPQPVPSRGQCSTANELTEGIKEVATASTPEPENNEVADGPEVATAMGSVSIITSREAFKEAALVEQTTTPGERTSNDENAIIDQIIPAAAQAEVAEGEDRTAADGELRPTSPPSTEIGTDTVLTASNEEEHPEWELDSSPIESSSDESSSDDSSSAESEDGDNAYKLLSPEEQAKILMEGDGGSDDEGDAKAKGSGNQLRTKNEVPDQVIPKPDVIITEDMSIEELGSVDAIVDSILLIKAKTTGEYRVLDSGSVLCLGDRSVIGVVSETLGRVQQPLYSVLFTNSGEIVNAGLTLGTTVFYSQQHSNYVFTNALKAYKGSDASNLHDEEVGDEEVEFSDDEAEAEHKRKVKQKKIEKRGGKMQQNHGPHSGAHPLKQQHTPYNASSDINYDDPDDDGPYKPLARPVGYADSVGRSEAPEEGVFSGGYDKSNREQNREQFKGRGRGDRGRGRADRGRGRGGYQDRRSDNRGGYSLPPAHLSPYSHPSSPGNFQAQGREIAQPPANSPGMPQSNFFNPSPQPYSPHQPQLMTWPQFPLQPPFPQPFQNSQNNWPAFPPAAPSTGGAFINALFFGNNLLNQQGQWNNQSQNQDQGGRGRGADPR